MNKLNLINKFSKLKRKNILILFIVVFSVLFILGCDITYNGTNLLVTPTATIIATIPVKTIVVTQTNQSFECTIKVDSVNTRSCADVSCSTIKIWAIRNDKIEVVQVSSDGQWIFWKNHGWLKAEYCEKN